MNVEIDNVLAIIKSRTIINNLFIDKIEDLIADPIFNEKRGKYNTEANSDWFGYGKVNATRAVKMAAQMHHGPQ